MLLRREAGDVMSCVLGVEYVGVMLSFGAGGENNWDVGAVLAKAAGERLRWEAWMVLVWFTGAALGVEAGLSSGAGGGEVTREEVFS